MKIALLSEKYTPDIGGLAISAARTARLLSLEGHEVFVYAPTSHLEPGEARSMPGANVQVTRFGVRKRVDDTLVQWFELVEHEHHCAAFDMLHAFFLPQAGFVAAYAGNYLKIPSLVSARGNDLDRAVFDPARAGHILYALEHASAVTANSADLARKAAALAPGANISIIPNGVDASLFAPAAKMDSLAVQFGISGMPVVGFCGELREKKGLAAILESAGRVAASRPLALLIVGDIRPGEDAALFSRLRAEHPRLKVVVTGYVSHMDLPAYYALMDVFLHPSLRDGLPNALLEAMACERPVIASPAGGIADFIQDGQNGSLVPAGDASALASEICRLLDDSDLVHRYGTNARITTLQKYTLNHEIEAYLKLYNRLGL